LSGKNTSLRHECVRTHYDIVIDIAHNQSDVLICGWPYSVRTVSTNTDMVRLRIALTWW